MTQWCALYVFLYSYILRKLEIHQYSETQTMIFLAMWMYYIKL